MRLYSIQRMPINGPRGKLLLSDGIALWEIAKQTQEGYYVRRHGHPRATTFVPKAWIGQQYFTSAAEVMKRLRECLRYEIATAKFKLACLMDEYGRARRGFAVIKEWQPGSIYSLERRKPRKVTGKGGIG